MSINSILSGLNRSVHTYQNVGAAQSASMQRVASGSRYTSAADDPAGYAILQSTYASIGAVHQANSNAQTANSMLQTAGGAAANTVSALSSLRSTLLEAANGTNGETDLAALQKSVTQTIAAVNDNASVAYNGKQLLDGSQTIAVQGADGYQNVALGNLTAQGLGLTDSQGSSTIDLTGKTSLSDALATVDKALGSALDQSTNIGAAQQGLTYQAANTTTQEENLGQTASAQGDTDIAAESVNLASGQAQSQAALFAIKQGLQSFSQQTLGALGGINNHSRGAAVKMLM